MNKKASNTQISIHTERDHYMLTHGVCVSLCLCVIILCKAVPRKRTQEKEREEKTYFSYELGMQ